MSKLTKQEGAAESAASGSATPDDNFAGSLPLWIETLCVLSLAQFAVRFCFPRVAPWALKPSSSTQAQAPVALRHRVRYMIGAGSRSVPWQSDCLANALAAKMMLSRRGFRSTLHMGAALPSSGFAAHAWLTAEDEIVVGGESSGAYRAFVFPA